MKTITVPLIVTAFILFLGVAKGHQDTKLGFKEGRISGLPADYSPASFDLNELELRIGDKKLKMPKEIRRIMMEDVSADPFDGSRTFKVIPYELHFTASWYHGDLGGDLPPYIVVNITPKDTSCRFEILVDMDALEVIKADISIADIGTIPVQLEIEYTPKIQKKQNESEVATPRKPSD